MTDENAIQNAIHTMDDYINAKASELARAIDPSDPAPVAVRTKLFSALSIAMQTRDGLILAISNIRIVPDSPGWYRWRPTPAHEWACVCLHEPTGDGLEVYLHGPISDFPHAEWGARIPMPDDADDMERG